VLSSSTTFSAKEAAAISGVPIADVDGWARRDVLSPSVRPASGRGSSRLFSWADIVALVVASMFKQLGLPPTRIQPLLRAIQARKDLDAKACPDEFVVLANDKVVSVGAEQMTSVFKAAGAGVSPVVYLPELVDECVTRHMALKLIEPFPRRETMFERKARTQTHLGAVSEGRRNVRGKRGKAGADDRD
jgi:DNA-binding transcriptional MerR regulator